MSNVFTTIKTVFGLILSVIVVSASPLLNCIGIEVFKDEVVYSLGDYETKDYYSSGGFQDYTDYALYTYEEMPDFTANPYFKPFDETASMEFDICLEEFEGWIETIREAEPDNKVVTEYDFDRTVVTNTDYFYAEIDYGSDEHSDIIYSFDMYLFDVETLTLFYFHNNI